MNRADVNDFMKEARHLWKFLDNLAENNPDQYRNFILKQAQEAGLTHSPSSPQQRPPSAKKKASTAKVSMMDQLANIVTVDESGDDKAQAGIKRTPLIEELD